MDTEPTTSITEAATALGVSEETVRGWQERGWLPDPIPLRLLASARAIARDRPQRWGYTEDEVISLINAPH